MLFAYVASVFFGALCMNMIFNDIYIYLHPDCDCDKINASIIRQSRKDSFLDFSSRLPAIFCSEPGCSLGGSGTSSNDIQHVSFKLFKGVNISTCPLLADFTIFARLKLHVVIELRHQHMGLSENMVYSQ